MKKALSLAICAATMLGANAAPAFSVASQDLIHGMDLTGVCEIDINNDGIVDFIISGRVRDKAVAGRIVEDAEGNENQIDHNVFQYVWNAATNSYDVSEFPYVFGNRACFAVADFNGDGLTDFVAAGEASQALHGVEFGMFTNNGNGTFTRSALNVVDIEGNPVADFDPRCVDVADFNSDGLLDIVSTGWKADKDNVRHHNNAVLINKGNGTFVATNTEFMTYGNNPIELALNTLVATDLNNDGYAEFLTQGNVDNGDEDRPIKDGKVLGRTFIAALNLGADVIEDGIPVLYDLGLADGVSHFYGHGGQEAFDFNNDGVMDIFVGGESPADARNDGDWNYHWQLLQGRITSDGVQYTDVTATQVFNNTGVRPLNDNKPIRAIDYTGNGEYDIFLPGWTEEAYMFNGDKANQAGWFFPNNNGLYSEWLHCPGASETSVFFTEDGVSGARNYAFTGYTEDRGFFGGETGLDVGRMVVYTKNQYGKAARPEAPASATATASGYNVTLEWTAPAGAKENVTYDYYIKDLSNGKFYRGVTAFVGGDKDGVRTTIAQGRAFMAKKLDLINLPDGNYEWGVQTVSASLEGSKFTKGNDFKIGNGGGVADLVSNAPVVATEYYDLTGRKLSQAPATGIVIKKDIRQDGTNSVSKIIR